MDAVELEILWSNLIGIVSERAKALQRIAFSPVVREAGDLACALFDGRGRMVAQANTGTPGHINSLAIAGAHLVSRFHNRIEPGDILVTNDPWLSAGHFFDITVLTPIFDGDKVDRLHRLDHPPHRYRRLRHRRRRPRRARGGLVDSAAQALPARRAVRDPACDDPLERAHARRGVRRPRRAGVERPSRQRTADRHVPALRPARHRAAVGRDHPPLRAGDPRGDPQAQGRHLRGREQVRCSGRRDHHLEGGGDDRSGGRRDHDRLCRQLAADLERHQRGAQLHPRLLDLRGAQLSQPRSAQQHRQPGADQGEGAGRLDRELHAIRRR